MTAYICREEHDAKLERILTAMRLDTQTQIQALQRETQTQFQTMQHDTQAQFQVMSSKIDRIADALEIRAIHFQAAFSALSIKIDTVDSKIDGLEKTLNGKIRILLWMIGIVAIMISLRISFL